MAKLDGITKLRGKIVALEEIKNPVLRRVLSERTDKDKFNFNKDDKNYEEHADVFEQHHEAYTENGAVIHRDFLKNTKVSPERYFYEEHFDAPKYVDDVGYSDMYSDHFDYCEKKDEVKND